MSAMYEMRGWLRRYLARPFRIERLRRTRFIQKSMNRSAAVEIKSMTISIALTSILMDCFFNKSIAHFGKRRKEKSF